MSTGNRQLAQRLIAIVVIVAILQVVGFSPAVIVFFLVAGVVIWRAVRRNEHQETERVFDFYVAADEVLRDDWRQWFGFEIAEVIDAGERVLISLPDPPPLTHFALGALYHRVGDFEPAVEHLTRVVDDPLANEVNQLSPSPQLRRYVDSLRRIEREPSLSPQTLAAVRSLERGRRKRAAEMLADSRVRLNEAAVQGKNAAKTASKGARGSSNALPLSVITAPPPISEVLRDVYQSEDKKTA